VDEAGRGPLAGPVVAAAVLLPAGHGIAHLRDSKKVEAREREALFDQIVSRAQAYAVEFVGVREIEEGNILRAALAAMRAAVEKIGQDLLVVVDGNQRIPGIGNPQRAVVKGDNRSASVAAASILAKVSRDRYMDEMDKKYPAYGFAAHKGYGTALHMEMLRVHGPCEIHRKTFKGVLK
jgi:ribonuclease HII